MKKEILRLDNKAREISKNVEKIDASTKQVVEDLLETLRTSERPGVGLAAPQIGENVRVVVIESEGYTRDIGEVVDAIPTLVLINPYINKYSKEKCVIEEGCLSVPDLLGPVERPKKVKVTAQDINGRTININASGFLARVLQHEIDHLDGILFIDLIPDQSKLIKISELSNEES
jgi:peptide deformylase